jgi:hypothetical protein
MDGLDIAVVVLIGVVVLWLVVEPVLSMLGLVKSSTKR